MKEWAILQTNILPKSLSLVVNRESCSGIYLSLFIVDRHRRDHLSYQQILLRLQIFSSR
jgi:hypothetical protein